MLFEIFSAFFGEGGLAPIKAKKAKIAGRVRRQAICVRLSSAYAKKTAEAVFFIHIILASGAEVCGLDLLVCEKLFAGAGHGKAAGFKDIANVSGFQRHICVLLD